MLAYLISFSTTLAACRPTGAPAPLPVPTGNLTLGSHFATCSRCQAQLAGVVRSAEAGAVVGGEGVAASWGWVWSWQGLVPVASAAVVVLAPWVVDPASLVDRSRSQETAFGEPGLVAPAASTPEAEERAPSAETIPAEPDLAAPRLELDQATRETFAAEPQGPRARRPQQANQAASPPQTAPDRDAQEVQSQLSAQPLKRALSAPPSAAAAARADDQLPDSPVPADAFRASRAATVSENRAVQFGATGGAAAAVAEQRLADARIASPTPSILWRLGASGRIERSTDEGQSWTLQADIGVELLAGGTGARSRPSQRSARHRTPDATRRVPPERSPRARRLRRRSASRDPAGTAAGSGHRPPPPS